MGSHPEHLKYMKTVGRPGRGPDSAGEDYSAVILLAGGEGARYLHLQEPCLHFGPSGIRLQPFRCC